MKRIFHLALQAFFDLSLRRGQEIDSDFQKKRKMAQKYNGKRCHGVCVFFPLISFG